MPNKPWISTAHSPLNHPAISLRSRGEITLNVRSRNKMPKTLVTIIPLISAVCIGCSQTPLTSEVVGVPPTVNSRQIIKLQVIVHNRSNKPQSIPYREVILCTTGLKFVPGTFPKHPASIDYPVNRVSLHVCPPGFDWICPADERRYNFTWTPESGDSGSGAFFVSLPLTLPSIPPQAMTITNQDRTSRWMRRREAP